MTQNPHTLSDAQALDPGLPARPRAAVARAEVDFPTTLEHLKRLVRIPSCSFPGFDHTQLDRSADACVEWLLLAGFPEARIARLPGVFPYVIAKDHRAEGAKTSPQPDAEADLASEAVAAQ